MDRGIASIFDADRWALDATLIEPHAYADAVVDVRISRDQTSLLVVARDGSLWRRSLIHHRDELVRSVIAPEGTFGDARFIDDALVIVEGDSSRWSFWHVELATGRRTLCRQSRGRSGATLWRATFGPFVEASLDRRAALSWLDGEAWVVLADGSARRVRSDAVRLLDAATLLSCEDDYYDRRSFVVSSIDGEEQRRFRANDPRLRGTESMWPPVVLDAEHVLLPFSDEASDRSRAANGIVYRWRDDTCIDMHAFLRDRGGTVAREPYSMGYHSQQRARWLPPRVAAATEAEAHGGFVDVLDHSARWVVLAPSSQRANDITVIDLATHERVASELRGRALRAWPSGDGRRVLTTHVDNECCLWDARDAALLDERILHGSDLRWISGDSAFVAVTSEHLGAEQRFISHYSCARSLIEPVFEQPLAPVDRRVIGCHPDAGWVLIKRTIRDDRGALRWFVVLASITGDARRERSWLSRIGCVDGDTVLLATERAVVRVAINDETQTDRELVALDGQSIPSALNRFGAVTLRPSRATTGAHELVFDQLDADRCVWRCDEPVSDITVATDAPVLAARVGADEENGRRNARVELRSFAGAPLGTVALRAAGDGVESFALSADGRALLVVSQRGGVYVLRPSDEATDASRPLARRA